MVKSCFEQENFLFKFVPFQIIILFVWFLLSSLFDLYYFIADKFNAAARNHDARVKEIQKKVRQCKDNGSAVQMCTARPFYQGIGINPRMYKKLCFNISINLDGILEVDTEKRIVRVEPLVTMGKLTSHLGKIGWTIPVVAELDHLTVGGLINGAGLESTSHIYGLFADTCVAYEMVLADGSLVRCTKDENSDLFYAVPFAHGTLGFMVSAEISMVACKKYVRLQYLPFYSLGDFTKNFVDEIKKKKPHEFVDGIMFSRDTGVIIVGDMTDVAESGKVNILSRYYKPWFYKHVETFLHDKNKSTGTGAIEYVPLRDYYHRYTKSFFWLFEYAIPCANTVWFRYLFGWMLPVRWSVAKVLATGSYFDLFEKLFVAEDLGFTTSVLKESFVLCDNEAMIYPIWFCGARHFKNLGFFNTGITDDLVVDVGFYGVPQIPVQNCSEIVRKIQCITLQQKGFISDYNNCHLTEAEFRQMFNHTLYDRMRIKLNCQNAFPEVYKKICHRIHF